MAEADLLQWWIHRAREWGYAGERQLEATDQSSSISIPEIVRRMSDRESDSASQLTWWGSGQVQYVQEKPLTETVGRIATLMVDAGWFDWSRGPREFLELLDALSEQHL